MFPNDPNTFAMDDQFMLGNALVVKPVIAKGQVQVTVYLPTSAVVLFLDKIGMVRIQDMETHNSE